MRRLHRDESGQSLLIVVSAMTVLLALAGFAIDTATWMVKHHQAQIVADSAAMAAAHCLANPGKSGRINVHGVQRTIPACSSGTDATDAQTVAIDYAAANGLAITASDVSVDTTSDRVTVKADSSAPGIFARVFGMANTTQTAQAGAAWTAGSGSCTTPGNSCDFMFAYNSDCTVATNGIDLNASGNTTVQGDIQSNGNITGHANGNISLGYGSYGPNGTGTCADTMSYNGHDPWATPPIQATADIPYPIDYSKDFPACGGPGEQACASNGYPSFCTNEGSSITVNGSTNGDVAITGNVYCAVGSGQPNDPSTWNGTIDVALQGSETLYDTFVGGTIEFSGKGNDTLSACGYSPGGYTSATCNSNVPAPSTTNYPIFYATGNSSSAIDLNLSGGQTLTGDVFAPNGTISLNVSGNKTLTTFIEGDNILANVAGTMQGDGPSVTGTGDSSGGTVSLVQ